ncbi:hypothetical protein EJB05_46557, partial [Eragrostis curvula]
MAKMVRAVAVVAVLALLFTVAARGQECGVQAGGLLCPDFKCCSQWGYCGNSLDFCGDGCQSQCQPLSGGSNSSGVASVAPRQPRRLQPAAVHREN